MLAKWNSFATGVKDTTNFNYYCAEGTWDDEIKGKVKVKGEDRDTTGNLKEWARFKKKAAKKRKINARNSDRAAIRAANRSPTATAEQKKVLQK